MERVSVCRTSKLYPLLLGLKDHRSHQRIQKEITKHMCLPHHFRATLKATEIPGIRIADLKNYQQSQFLKSTSYPIIQQRQSSSWCLLKLSMLYSSLHTRCPVLTTPTSSLPLALCSVATFSAVFLLLCFHSPPKTYFLH